MWRRAEGELERQQSAAVHTEGGPGSKDSKVEVKPGRACEVILVCHLRAGGGLGRVQEWGEAV